MTKDNRLNNARLETFGAYIPLYDIECVDVKQGICRGKGIRQPNQREELWPWYYFSRKYQPDINDFDKLFTEIELSKEMFGVKVTLVPKEKLLFRYQPHSTILVPPPKIVKRGQ